MRRGNIRLPLSKVACRQSGHGFKITLEVSAGRRVHSADADGMSGADKLRVDLRRFHALAGTMEAIELKREVADNDNNCSGTSEHRSPAILFFHLRLPLCRVVRPV